MNDKHCGSSRRAADFRCGFVLVCLLVWGAPTLRGLIFYSTGDPDFNTAPPAGELAGSGWEWVGKWGNFQGTPIGPRHFITARHVGGKVGQTFVLGGVAYVTTAYFDDPLSDLRLWQIDGWFPSWAPLYRGKSEQGKRFVVFGRGGSRGEEVRDLTTKTLRGWKWAHSDGRLRWGENSVVEIADAGKPWGILLYALFHVGSGRNTVHLAQGDSGGPLFIRDGQAWKLAGVAASVDAMFRLTRTGPGFNAAIFDRRGLFFGNDLALASTSEPKAVPSGFYATRISVRTTWIDEIIDEPGK